MGIEDIINNEQYARVTGLQKFSKMVVTNETKRLDQKKASMDTEASNKKKMIQLNRSYQDRQRQFLVLMILFLLIFIICLVIVVFQERLGYSSVMMDFMLLIVVVIGGASGYLVVLNILNRDKVDFSKINEAGLLQPDDIIDKTKLKEEVVTVIPETVSETECVGAECCGPGFTYNSSTGVCNNNLA